MASPLTPINARGPWPAIGFGRPVALSVRLVLGTVHGSRIESVAK
jgi:hypothetical protein